MKDLSFYIVDVFAEEKFAGNQLAVFLNTAGLSGDEMQRLAREMHYSETTFIDSAEERNGGYNVRIFTPEEEVPFAGHPTIGTAFVINKYVRQMPAEKILLNLEIGQIPVDIEKDSGIYWMTQKEPEFGEIFSTETAAKILSLDEND
ncbi:MAG: PhzF family phenazine biosynthesis isomerase, partial [Candidatus Marinimicrobia bacterium]|nr:PhzF family phenazine biosynthesis isomerase [Candidatus Neomarinimicrobiota bacterium]